MLSIRESSGAGDASAALARQTDRRRKQRRGDVVFDGENDSRLILLLS